MDEPQKQQVQKKFEEYVAPLLKGNRSFEAKALFDDIAQEWIVAIYFISGNKLDSLIFASVKDHKVAKEVAVFLQELLDKKFPKGADEILKL